MSEENVMKSYMERLAEPRKIYPKTLCSDYDARVCEDVVVNGRIVKKSVYRSVHPQDRFKGFVASDFALENVLAAGAFDTLKSCSYGVDSCGELSDLMEGSINNAIAAVDAAEQSNEGGND